MCKIYLFGNEKEQIQEGALALLMSKGYAFGTKEESDIIVEAILVSENLLEIIWKDEAYQIRYGKKAYFFRGLMELLRQVAEGKCKGDVRWSETGYFESNGIMLDCSRNAVAKVSTVKDWVRKLAAVGMNTLYLYMEDTYEVEGYPYFGYMRGRYTQEELKECDDYADALGVEIIPCIQTLAHLRTTLRMQAFVDIRDTEDILLVGEEKTATFVEAMIRSASKPFRTKRIHVGMDEADLLGHGKYLKKNGYVDGSKIMESHLELVAGICQKLDLKPQIWSDMFFRLHSSDGDYYTLSEDTDVSGWEKPPASVELVYWDYYNLGKDFYKGFLALHKKLSKEVIFAGGGWTWNGLAPSHTLAMETTLDALDGCKKSNIQHVFCTFWGDNGNETPLTTGYPTVLLFAENGFTGNDYADACAEQTVFDNELFQKRFAFCFGEQLENFLFLEEFDLLQGTLPGNRGFDNPSKYLLFQDPLLGLFDKHLEGRNAKAEYEEVYKRISSQEPAEEYKDLFLYFEYLAEVLVHKSELGKNITTAYQNKDTKALQEAIQTIQVIQDIMKKLKKQRRIVWMSENKPFGYECVDIRFAGVETRLETTKDCLEDYLEGRIEKIAELEEERLLYKKGKSEEHTHLSCNRWEYIISPGNMWGV